MAHNTSSDSDNEISTRTKLFEHEKPIHEILGGGKVADILLWRDRNESAKLFLAMTVIWKDPPHVPEIILQESFFNDLALILYKRFNQILPLLFLLTCLSHLPVFLMIIVSLYVVSVIGSYFSFINLLYIGYLCMQTLPIVFERYDEEINNLFGDIMLVLKKIYRKFEKNYLRRIPRGPLKDKKAQ
ncbi:reticulon-like protein B9 isoform X3 [Lathyrus oleraceus]|uniref:reticulon-like protein B9 isoform X3 n=1 Tax=Pisum sativum TaxID=3888 RepID=UPI0021CE90FD|nr:reticulon-like protein B9 isoform X3 [Pisum sativum]